jgi:hypothetical protein
LNSSRDGIEELRAAGVPVFCSTDSGVYVIAVAQTDIVMTQSSEYFCVVSLPSSSCRKRKVVKNVLGGGGWVFLLAEIQKENKSPLS